jgi:hypothetical protein
VQAQDSTTGTVQSAPIPWYRGTSTGKFNTVVTVVLWQLRAPWYRGNWWQLWWRLHHQAPEHRGSVAPGGTRCCAGTGTVAYTGVVPVYNRISR